MLFSMGGLFCIYEGLHKIDNGEPLQVPWIAGGVLVFSLADGLASCSIRTTRPSRYLRCKGLRMSRGIGWSWALSPCAKRPAYMPEPGGFWGRVLHCDIPRSQ